MNDADALLGLQRTVGNQAVLRMLQRGAAAPPGAAAVPAVQRKTALVSGKTRTRKVDDSVDLAGMPDNDARVKAIEKATKGPEYDRFSTIELRDVDWHHQRDNKGQVAWYAIKPAGKPTDREYVAADKVATWDTGDFTRGAKPSREDKESSLGGEIAEGALTGGKGIFDASDEYALDYARALTLEQQDYRTANPNAPEEEGPQGASTGLTRGEGALWMGGGILGMAGGLRDLCDNEKSAWERVSAAFSYLASGSATTGAITQVITTHVSEDSEEYANASAISAWSLGFQEMFTTLAAAVKTMKGIVDLVKLAMEAASGKGVSTAKVVKTLGDFLISGLETAKGVLRSIRQINETFLGAVTTQFAQWLPGIDIAITAVKTIMQGYYLTVSAVQWHTMKAREAALLEEAQTENPQVSKKSLETQREHLRKREAGIAQLDAMIGEKTKKIAEVETTLAKTKDPKKRKALEEKLKSLREKKAEYEKTRALKERITGVGSDSVSEEQLAEYDLAAMLRETNTKRVVRQSVHIVTNLISIAGSIASLVSGPGAPAAIGVKAAAAGVDMSLPFLRWLKQQGRDVAARNRAKGEEGIANKIFNADKSTAAKLADRKKQAVLMLLMVARLTRLPPSKVKERAAQVEAYLRASGVDLDDLYALNGKPGDQIQALVKALAQRELGD